MPDMQSAKIIEEDIYQICSSNIPWEKMCGKTILISGANGYVPAYFVHTFLQYNDSHNHGLKVIALCRNEKKAIARFEAYRSRADFSLLVQDVCDPIQVQNTIHFFIHAASPASVSQRHADPISTFNANVIGAKNMLDCASIHPCEGFLFISSIDIYGKMPHCTPAAETTQGSIDSLNIKNAYALGKRAAEFLCAAYHAQHAIPSVIVRPGQIIGPGVAINDGRLHIDFISQMLKSDEILLKSDGSAKRTFMYITDAIEGMLVAMLYGAHGEAYNVVDESSERTVFELASAMASAVVDRKINVAFDSSKLYSAEVVNALPCVTAHSNKLRELGWAPQIGLDYGIKRMMKYYGLVVE